MKYCPKCDVTLQGNKEHCKYCGQLTNKVENEISIEELSKQNIEPEVQEIFNGINLIKVKKKIEENKKEDLSTERLIGSLMILLFGIILFLMILALTVFSELNPFSSGHIIPIIYTIIGIVLGIWIMKKYKNLKIKHDQEKPTLIEDLHLNVGGSIDLPEISSSYFNCFGYLVLFIIVYFALGFFGIHAIPVILLSWYLYYKTFKKYCMPRTKIVLNGFILHNIFISKIRFIKWTDVTNFKIIKNTKIVSDNNDNDYVKEVYSIVINIIGQEDIELNLGLRDPEIIDKYLTYTLEQTA